jgi:hypothetical protein
MRAAPHEHDIDLPPSRRLQQSLACLPFAAPEPTSRTCRAIIQPRRPAYSRMARFCIAKSLLIIRRNAQIESCAKHFQPFSWVTKKRGRICCLRGPFLSAFHEARSISPHSSARQQCARHGSFPPRRVSAQYARAYVMVHLTKGEQAVHALSEPRRMLHRAAYTGTVRALPAGELEARQVRAFRMIDRSTVLGTTRGRSIPSKGTDPAPVA